MTQLRLAAVGDISLGDHLLTLGFGVRSEIARRGPEHLFARVAPRLRSADIVFGNLECAVTEAGSDPARPLTDTFRATEAGVRTLAAGGFNVVNVANNHALQYGAEGFHDTLQAIGRAGIAAAGVAAAGDFHCAPVIKTVNNVRVGLLAYSQAAENFFQGEPLYARWRPEHVFSDIAQLRPQVDFLVVSCHWGIEQIDYAPVDVVQAARALVDAGVDVVLGHHSHIFQSVERYAQGLICYSLGNFVFDTLWEPYSTQSAIVEITLALRDGAKHITHEVVPVRINAAYQPEPLDGAERLRFLARLDGIQKAQTGIASLPPDAIERMTAERERDLNRRKILHVVRSAHRVRSATWRVLFLDKLLRRLGIAPAGTRAGARGS